MGVPVVHKQQRVLMVWGGGAAKLGTLMPWRLEPTPTPVQWGPNAVENGADPHPGGFTPKNSGVNLDSRFTLQH